MRTLSDMTLEELWQLFPIILTPHQAQWSDWAVEEIESLQRTLSDFSPTITHIGSTAIADIWAKPIIDLLVEVPLDADRLRLKATMERQGYICMSSSAMRQSFNKGYTPEGFAERVFHIHARPIGDNDEILFRDYLREHPSVARDYETLKLSLLPQYEHDRDGYTDAKSDFVRRVTELAKKAFC
ncbi:MAG: GrpB family protein [Bacteroidaceae bacterium]|nr:GrpB family protein [Bacteroidaceae bacterium]